MMTIYHLHRDCYGQHGYLLHELGEPAILHVLGEGLV